jgi:hypothetical protein
MLVAVGLGQLLLQLPWKHAVSSRLCPADSMRSQLPCAVFPPFSRCVNRHTELLVLVPAAQTTVGLHCFNLTVHRVTVNGAAAQVCADTFGSNERRGYVIG